ncbi:MAG: DUF5123 domain-containing protein [Pseudomonadota bacterium]
MHIAAFRLFGGFAATLVSLLGCSASSNPATTPGPTNGIVPYGVYVFHSRFIPAPDETVTFTATTPDGATTTAIVINVDGANVQTCSSSPCVYTASYSTEGSHSYYATATFAGSPSARDPASDAKAFTASSMTRKTLSSCQDITETGYYLLTQDLTDADHCFVITAAHDVVLDGWDSTLGRRHTITLTGAPDCGSGMCAVQTRNSSSVTVTNVESTAGGREFSCYDVQAANVTFENSAFDSLSFYCPAKDLVVRNNSLKSLSVNGGGTCEAPAVPERMQILHNRVVNDGPGAFSIIGGPRIWNDADCLHFEVNGLIEDNFFKSDYPNPDTDAMAYIRGGIAHSTFRNNRFISRAGLAAVYIRDGADNNLWENNYFEAQDSERGALFIGPGNGTPWPADNIFRNNFFRGVNSGAVGDGGWSGTGNTYENNVFWAGNGQTAYTYHNMFSGENTVIRHNTFYSEDAATGALRLGSPSVTFENNIVVHKSASNIFDSTGCNADGYSGDDNVFFGHETPPLQLCGLSFTDWRTQTGDDANSLEADPLFVDPTGGDFHLQSSSPACNLGGDYAGAFPRGG